MKLLITGGAGFMGSAVTRHIMQTTGDDVVNVNKLTYAGNLGCLAEACDNLRYAFKQVDICNRPERQRVFDEQPPGAPPQATPRRRVRA